jgi:polar amino acid transport system substrate-binding protein
VTRTAHHCRQHPAARCATLLVAAGLSVGACARTDVPESLPGPTSSTTATTAPPPATPAGCTPETVTASSRPAGPATAAVAPGSYMAEIQQRGRLRVGVDTSTLQFSSVDPFTGDFIGFDVEIAREVAAALFGQATDENIEFVAIPKSERVGALLGDEPLDLVADTFTITCARDAEIDFSSEYFTSHQRLLVRNDDPSTSIVEFAGRPVCAPAGSTSIDNMNALPDPPEAVGAASQGDCLVLLQQGRVDAISTDDTILAGMRVQDPTVRIVGEALSTEPYGLGLPPGRTEWARYVNAVLEDVRASGRWDELYDAWFLALLEVDAQPPSPVYED